MGWTSRSRRVRRGMLVGALLAAGLVAGGAPPPAAAVAGPSVVISQIYGGGGNANATFTHDFVELFNRGDTAQNLDTFAIQKASVTGTTWQVEDLPNVDLQPGQYFLVRFHSTAAVGSPLPTPDHMGSTTIDLSQNGGKVLLANTTVAQTGSCPTNASIDFITYGATDCAAEISPAAGMSSILANIRKLGGCQDTNNNSVDFEVVTPNPRNSATTAPCRPDLTVTGLSDPLSEVVQGDSMPITDTTANNGTDGAPSSTTAYFLSSDGLTNTASLNAGRTLDPLPAGGSNQQNSNVVVPSNTSPGEYWLRACADSDGVITETNEANNCMISANKVTVLAAIPNLEISTHDEPPATVLQGGQFTVNDTTTNSGTADSPASTTTHYLSPEGVANDISNIAIKSRPVGGLSAGASSLANPEGATVPVGTAPGNYWLITCADSAGIVIESDEADNCRTSVGQVEVIALPDLHVTTVGSPPASRMQGTKFPLSDTTKNLGGTDSVAGITRYFLSADAVWDDTDIVHFSRNVPQLAPAAESIGAPTSVKIPLSTPIGNYRLIACADISDTTDENHETDNCTTAAGTLAITKALPDLVVTAVSDPPASRKRGTTFSVTETVKNKGLAKAGASETWYYLSADKVAGNDKQLTGARDVGPLAVGAASQDAQKVAIPSTTKLGSYFVLACADGGKLRPEIKENNNCRSTATKIEIVRG